MRTAKYQINRYRLMELLARHFWTQKDLADKIEMNPQTVYNISNGRRTTEETARKIARCLGVDFDFITAPEK